MIVQNDPPTSSSLPPPPLKKFDPNSVENIDDIENINDFRYYIQNEYSKWSLLKNSYNKFNYNSLVINENTLTEYKNIEDCDEIETMFMLLDNYDLLKLIITNPVKYLSFIVEHDFLESPSNFIYLKSDDKQTLMLKLVHYYCEKTMILTNRNNLNTENMFDLIKFIENSINELVDYLFLIMSDPFSKCKKYILDIYNSNTLIAKSFFCDASAIHCYELITKCMNYVKPSNNFCVSDIKFMYRSIENVFELLLVLLTDIDSFVNEYLRVTEKLDNEMFNFPVNNIIKITKNKMKIDIFINEKTCHQDVLNKFKEISYIYKNDYNISTNNSYYGSVKTLDEHYNEVFVNCYEFFNNLFNKNDNPKPDRNNIEKLNEINDRNNAFINDVFHRVPSSEPQVPSSEPQVPLPSSDPQVPQVPLPSSDPSLKSPMSSQLISELSSEILSLLKYLPLPQTQIESLSSILSKVSQIELNFDNNFNSLKEKISLNNDKKEYVKKLINLMATESDFSNILIILDHINKLLNTDKSS